MTDDRELSLIIDRWLEEGPVEMPDRVIDTTAVRISRQRQQPAWRLDWRHLTMNTTYKITAAIAAIAIIGLIGYNLLPGRSTGVGGPGPTASPTASPSVAISEVTIVDPAGAGSDIPAAVRGTYSEGDWNALPVGDDRYSWQLLPAGDTKCVELVHLTTSCIVITRQPSDIEQYGPAAVVGDLIYYKMIIHNFQTDPCLNQVSVWRFSVLTDRLTMQQLDPGCRNSLDDAGFLLRTNP